MRKLVVLIGCIFILGTSHAQTYSIDDLNQTVFLYPDFYKGKVLFKNGSVQHAIFNYNTLFQQMIYVQNGVMLALDDVVAIDTVYVDSLRFIPVDSSFYEVKLAQSPVPLFIKYNVDVTRPAPATPFGGTSQTGAVQNISSYRFGVATPYQLKVADNYTVRKFAEYYIRSGGRFIQIKGIKQIKQLYPASEKQIHKFIKNHHIRFDKTGDMEKLLSFIGTVKELN